jgi:hypothetical protein
MWQRNPKPWRLALSDLKSKARILFMSGIALLVLVVTAFIVRETFEKNIRATVRDEVSRIKSRTGIVIGIRNIDVGFKSVELSQVTIGQQPWLELDRIVVSISLNPFADFLRPDSVNIGIANLKLPRDKERWPNDVKKIGERLLKPGSSNNRSKTSLAPLFLPKRLTANVQQLFWSDMQGPVVDLQDVGVSMNFIDKRVATRVAGVVAFDRIKEKFLEVEVRLTGGRSVQLNVRKRPEFKGRPLWSGSCNLLQNPLSGRCDVDADRLPDLLLSYFQSKLGQVFAPGFHGGIGVEAIDGRTLKKFRLSLHGVLENIYVEHPALAVNPVGPVNMRSNIDIDVDMGRRSASAGKSELFVFSPKESGGLGIPVSTEFSLTLNQAAGEVGLPNGDLQLYADRIHCASILQTIPESFAPELVGFEMEGHAALRAQIHLGGDGAKFSISGSSFECDVTSAPEMYSAAYLLGPFVIERETPSGKITIPVDPARPYYVAYKDVPLLVRSAFVSSEDTGFFRHQGVEIGALVGAVQKNALVKRAAVGGSTITMQTVKNLFLARDKTLSRKMQEIFLAWHLERTISKERILEIYLNMVEFGPGLFGIGRASQKFFSKDPSELTLKEAIYLASLLPAPIPRYRYFCKGELTPNYNKIIRQLLDRMLMLGRISAAQHAVAIAEKIEFSKIERDAGCGIPLDQSEPATDTESTD